MNKTETIAIVAKIKVAYPYYYKDINEDERKIVYSLWYNHFHDVPYAFMNNAIDNLIATKRFPPTISEVNEEFERYLSQAYALLNSHNLQLKENTEWERRKDEFKGNRPDWVGNTMDEERLNTVQETIMVLENRNHRLNEIAWLEEKEKQLKITGG